MDFSEKEFLLSLYSFNNNLSDSQKIKRLYAMSNNVSKYYKKFTIKKRNGKERKILSPCNELKLIQSNILNKLLYDKRPSVYAKAYIKNISLVDNVSIHKGFKYISKLDISDFFENISYVDVYNIFKEYAFSNRLCGLLAHLTTYDDYLPQGAPTSPFLSNLVLRGFDYKIGEWCENNNINYTRYSDDMTFSMDEFNKELVRYVRKNLYKYGLELNNDKICLIKSSSQQKITGIVVNEKIQVDSKYRRNIRQEVYYIIKYGIDEHIRTKKINNKNDYLKSLYGKILFVLSVDKGNKEFIKYKNIIRKLVKESYENKRNEGFELSKNELMDEQELLNFALDQAIAFLKKEGYEIENANNMLGICPNIIAMKSNKKYCLFIEGNEVRKQPKITEENLNKMLEYAEKYNCIPLYGSFGFGASNHERFEKEILLKNDPEGYYVNFTGFDNLSNIDDGEKEQKQVDILNKAFNKQMKKYNDEKELRLTDYECDCYSNCFYVIYELTGSQYTFEEIFEIYDYFTDVKDGKKPNVDLFKEKEAFRGFYRLSKNYPLTRDLEEDERIYLCFAIYLASCIMTYDEKTKDVSWNMECFENGPQYVIDEYEHEIEFKEELRIIPTSEEEKDDYGLTVENPIEVTSVAIEYQYLNGICLENGDFIEYDRIGSFGGKDDIFVDGYTIYNTKTGKEITTLYITGDGSKNTKKVPKGFRFITEDDIKDEETPKKEKKKKDKISDDEEFECPNCDTIVTVKDKKCPNCGIKLNW